MDAVHTGTSLLGCLVLAAVPLVSSGCVSSHEGEIGWVDQGPKVSEEVRIVRTVEARASMWRLFGIFGSGKRALFARARNNLVEKAKLNDDQQLVNRTLDVTSAAFPPEVNLGIFGNPLNLFRMFYRKTVHLSAEVIESAKDSD